MNCPDWFVSKYELNNHNKSVHGIAQEMLPKSRQKQNLQNLENFDKIELILNENNVLLAFNQSEEKSPSQLASDEKDDIKPAANPGNANTFCDIKINTNNKTNRIDELITINANLNLDNPNLANISLTTS